MSRRLSLVMLFGLITTAVLSFGLSGGAGAQSAASVDDEMAAAKQRLADLRMEAGSAYEAHDNAVLQLAELDEAIAASGEELATAQKELEAAEADLQVLAAQMYKSGNVGFVDVLVGAEDFSEFANRLELWMDLIVQQRDEFESVRAARDALAPMPMPR
jgi:peptidoglycan DL-endopeptidase RipA